jgi:hypothetical protein
MEQHQRSGVYEPVSRTDVCPNIAIQNAVQDLVYFPEWFLPMILHIFMGLTSLKETIVGSSLSNIHLHTSNNLYATGWYYCESVLIFSGTQPSVVPLTRGPNMSSQYASGVTHSAPCISIDCNKVKK